MLKSIQSQGRVTPAIGSGHLRRIRAAEDFSKPRRLGACAWMVRPIPIGIVDDPIHDGVREGGLADDGVPFISGKLAGDERRAVAMAVLDSTGKSAPLSLTPRLRRASLT
jgi:hypothetical protein